MSCDPDPEALFYQRWPKVKVRSGFTHQYDSIQALLHLAVMRC